MADLAYIVIREGSKWSDVFQLKPGRTVTLGRAPTNQVVIKDERCSRFHAEVFKTAGVWTIRDLESRNGIMVDNNRILGDHGLTPGEIIRIAHTQMAFVEDLSTAFPEGDSILSVVEEGTSDTFIGLDSDADSVLDTQEPTITHRKGQTKFLRPQVSAEEAPIPKVGQAATQLCRLAFELAKQTDVITVAKMALDGVFDGTSVNAGAVLLQSHESKKATSEEDLEIVASRFDDEPAYQRISRFLARTVMRDGEAVLARNVGDDSTLGRRDSKGEIHATSVICAPIRKDRLVIGLIHLYSTDPDKPFDPDDLEFTLAVADNVALALKNLKRQRELTQNLNQSKDEINQLRAQLGAESEIIGSSPLLEKVHREIMRSAPTRATVLIRGESGVGKELVARAVHYASPRASGPFVCLNCAALSESLLESELFGHERGAFTGATDRKIGKFEAADAGTLMLDEIGEMSPTVQAKFLRVLEGHPFERVGGSAPIQVQVRVIAATNRDLEKAVAEGKFRRDLYFRLHVVEIIVPPLRKRPGDIVELADFFLQRYNTETGRRILGFMPAAIQQMQAYRWPGNVRELKNVVERAVVLAQKNYIDTDDLALSSLATMGDSTESPVAVNAYEPLTLAEIEKRHIKATLNATGWNKSKTAGILCIERSTLDRKIRRYELSQTASSRG